MAVGMQNMTVAKAIQHTVIMLTTGPNFPSEKGAFLTTVRLRKRRIRIGRP